MIDLMGWVYMCRHNGIRYSVKSMTLLTNSNPLKTHGKIPIMCTE